MCVSGDSGTVVLDLWHKSAAPWHLFPSPSQQLISLSTSFERCSCCRAQRNGAQRTAFLLQFKMDFNVKRDLFYQRLDTGPFVCVGWGGIIGRNTLTWLVANGY